jgi:predicted ribosome-associated RNA-binding protein Tma20
MFRKERELTSSETWNLSIKLIEQLIETISRQIPNLSRSQILQIFPPKKRVVANRLISGTILYSIQGNVVVLDLLGKGDIFPSLFLLIKYPNCLPTFVVQPYLVSEHILKGADLMFPAVLRIEGSNNATRLKLYKYIYIYLLFSFH